MKDTLKCFCCGKELQRPKRQTKRYIKCSKNLCDPKWVKLSCKEDEDDYYFILCPKCYKSAVEATNKN